MKTQQNINKNNEKTIQIKLKQTLQTHLQQKTTNENNTQCYIKKKQNSNTMLKNQLEHTQTHNEQTKS